jgi:hypothetical protein
MKKLNFLIPCLVLLAFSDMARGQNAKWELLGQRIVNFRIDRDEIHAGAVEGTFNALRIVVRRGSLNMHKVLIHYGNGDVQEVELRYNFARGSESRIIDLPGNQRIIRKIVFYYDTDNRARAKAVVEVFGRH